MTSVSDGTVAVLQGGTELDVSQTWKAHDYEPWIAAFDYWDTECIWTGEAYLYITTYKGVSSFREHLRRRR